jgi:hypothetical protein
MTIVTSVLLLDRESTRVSSSSSSFGKSIVGLPSTEENGADVKELRRRIGRKVWQKEFLDVGKDCGKWTKLAYWKTH